MRRRITGAGLQTRLRRADELDLLDAVPDYPYPGVTDIGTTTVEISSDRGRLAHAAYARGYERESGARGRLAEFVEERGDLETLVGADNIGPAEPYRPKRYQVSIGGFFGMEEDAW
ncbi:MAG: hypothetical protein H0U21_14740 [Acidimicrobiia bacterium]|nr:hypothetical protein [Acidimicrobiia bacterium]